MDLLHRYDTLAWRNFSDSIKNKKYGLFKIKTTAFAELLPDPDKGWFIDRVIDALATRSSDDIIIASERAFKQLQLHRDATGESLLRELDSGLYRYMRHIVLRCESGARVQLCCYSQVCSNHYYSDFVICPIDAVTVIE